MRRNRMKLIDEEIQLNGHYKNLLAAKSAIDTSVPRSLLTYPNSHYKNISSSRRHRKSRSESRLHESDQNKIVDKFIDEFEAKSNKMRNKPITANKPRVQPEVKRLSATYERRFLDSDVIKSDSRWFKSIEKPFEPKTLALNTAQSKIQGIRDYNPPYSRRNRQAVATTDFASSNGAQELRSLPQSLKRSGNLSKSFAFGAGGRPALVRQLTSTINSNGRGNVFNKSIARSITGNKVQNFPPKNATSNRLLTSHGRGKLAVNPKDDEAKYVLFLADVTEDILSYQTYTNSAIKHVFDKHILKHANDLRLEKMYQVLATVLDDLNISKQGFFPPGMISEDDIEEDDDSFQEDGYKNDNFSDFDVDDGASTTSGKSGSKKGSVMSFDSVDIQNLIDGNGNYLTRRLVPRPGNQSSTSTSPIAQEQPVPKSEASTPTSQISATGTRRRVKSRDSRTSVSTLASKQNSLGSSESLKTPKTAKSSSRRSSKSKSDSSKAKTPQPPKPTASPDQQDNQSIGIHDEPDNESSESSEVIEHGSRKDVVHETSSDNLDDVETEQPTNTVATDSPETGRSIYSEHGPDETVSKEVDSIEIKADGHSKLTLENVLEKYSEPAIADLSDSDEHNHSEKHDPFDGTPASPSRQDIEIDGGTDLQNDENKISPEPSNRSQKPRITPRLRLNMNSSRAENTEDNLQHGVNDLITDYDALSDQTNETQDKSNVSLSPNMAEDVRQKRAKFLASLEHQVSRQQSIDSNNGYDGSTNPVVEEPDVSEEMSQAPPSIDEGASESDIKLVPGLERIEEDEEDEKEQSLTPDIIISDRSTGYVPPIGKPEEDAIIDDVKCTGIQQQETVELEQSEKYDSTTDNSDAGVETETQEDETKVDLSATLTRSHKAIKNVINRVAYESTDDDNDDDDDVCN